jgi:hypothetical protein
MSVDCMVVLDPWAFKKDQAQRAKATKSVVNAANHNNRANRESRFVFVPHRSPIRLPPKLAVCLFRAGAVCVR